jgi:hypothetical protein
MSAGLGAARQTIPFDMDFLLKGKGLFVPNKLLVRKWYREEAEGLSLGSRINYSIGFNNHPLR